ncbi:helix-turn-helix domain-containing protein [Rhodococcus sp. IEGM 1379]|uniref:helix-turn-helix domain-containing protein n=1 Tax=Rhodococcus sp. IEGM 1379 TaxID=3047086 RepID=UPI0024B723A1|nr:helix-turn-helix domain-containing protein [Rhodococcus sp. IEGM 1379]MDI9915153.1 helix-turn-helix domain-containing protein [Rhodococcus sp. IEGM 1379]
MLTGRRYQVRFTPAQHLYADEVAGICRTVWNTGLDQRRHYRQRQAWINYHQQAKELTEAKRDPELVWLADAPGHCLQQTLMDLDKACRAHGVWKIKSTGTKVSVDLSITADAVYERRDRNPLARFKSISLPLSVRSKSAGARVPIGVPSRRGASTLRVRVVREPPLRTSTTPISGSNRTMGRIGHGVTDGHNAFPLH